jgi:imidazolonepropionase-like amidohydrolase
MACGGVASPTDRIDSTQYATDELRAAVEEATAANRYVAAHAYTARAVNRALEAGVRSIEHGNLIDEATARVMKTEGAYLVPTLSTYRALADEGERLGWSAEMLAKLVTVTARGIESVQLALAEGVPVVFGTDLLGHMHDRQNGEFDLRAPAMSPTQMLQSATFTAAQLLREEGRLGELTAGAWADMLLVEGDPTCDASMLTKPQTGVPVIIQGGRVVKNALAS